MKEQIYRERERERLQRILDRLYRDYRIGEKGKWVFD